MSGDMGKEKGTLPACAGRSLYTFKLDPSPAVPWGGWSGSSHLIKACVASRQAASKALAVAFTAGLAGVTGLKVYMA